METPQIKFRLGPDVLAQIDTLKAIHGLDTRVDVVRYAISAMYYGSLEIEKKRLRNAEKLA